MASPSQTAVDSVLTQLRAVGINDDASVFHMAITEQDLRGIAPEVIGPCNALAGGYSDEAWYALLHVWRQSAFMGRRWVEAEGLRLAA